MATAEFSCRWVALGVATGVRMACCNILGAASSSDAICPHSISTSERFLLSAETGGNLLGQEPQPICLWEALGLPVVVPEEHLYKSTLSALIESHELIAGLVKEKQRLIVANKSLGLWMPYSREDAMLSYEQMFSNLWTRKMS